MPNPFLISILTLITTLATTPIRLGVVGILAREDVKVLTVYVDLSVICVGCVDCVICIGLEV
jgi:hypothetical protein